MTGNCRRQKKPTFPPARVADEITHATDITFEYADTSEFENRLLGYVMRSSSSEAHAVAAKVEPCSVHAPATLAAPSILSNTCLPASAYIPGTPDAHRLSLTRLHNVNLSTICVPETPVSVATSHLLSARATNSIRCIPAPQVPHILCSQNVVTWLVVPWKRWPYAHCTCIT